jgi:hypothetical protein
MPAFLRAFPPVAGLPYLPAAAELDRAWTAAHVAADAPALSAEDARALAGTGGLEAAGPGLHPSVRLVATGWTLYPLWTALRADAPPPDSARQLQRGAETVLLWRPGHEVMHRRLRPAEAAFLARVRDGATLGAAGAAASEAEADADLAALFAELLQAGVFAAPAGA